MALIKKVGFFGAPLLIMAAGALATQGCDGGEVCGPCGEIENGATGISGSAKLDGFFKAVGLLSAGSATAQAQFEAGLVELEAAFDVEANGDLDARVTAVVAEITAQVEANASGSLSVDIQPAKCEANVNVSVEAQADCEVEAGCSADVKCDPGEVSVTCEGSCTGSCSGGCEGEIQCSASVSGEAVCEGKCEGSCEVDGSVGCEGTCRGECDGECSATVTNAEGEAECAGSCSGNCNGTCELKVAAECEGNCTGKCTANVEAEANCDGEVKCEGSCTGECSGGCEGTAKAPSCEGQAECDARADCEASASAQASASVECTPPSVAINFAFDGDASAQAAFTAKMAALQVNAIGMLSSTARYKALFEGNNCAAVEIGNSLNAVVSAGVEGDLFVDVPAGKITCAFDGLQESVSIIGELTGEATTTLLAQAKFAAAVSTGFSGG